MPLGMKVIADPKFTAVVTRWRERSNLIAGAEIGTLVRSAANAAKVEARLNLKDLVYTAPLPPSARRIWPANPDKYLAMDAGGWHGRRTGHIWRATKTRTVSPMVADMFIDSSDSAMGDAPFYYAWILNFGGTKINYPSKPFFSITVKVMRARFYGMGGVTLGRMKGGLLGYTLPAVAGDIGTDL
jgi:hypothetical protein